MQSGDVQELRLVVKADVQGSVEALQSSLTDLATEKVKVNVIHTGVGGITENDVMLASASQAIVLGFNVRPQGKASSTAKKEAVEIRTYSVIYEAIDEVKAAMKGLLAPKIVQEDLGKAEVRQTFGIPKIGTIAGCMVLEGKINRGAQATSRPRWRGRVGGPDGLAPPLQRRHQRGPSRHGVRHRASGLQRRQRARHHRVLRREAGRGDTRVS